MTDDDGNVCYETRVDEFTEPYGNCNQDYDPTGCGPYGCYDPEEPTQDCGPYGFDDNGTCIYEDPAPLDCGPYGYELYGECQYEDPAPLDCGPYGMDDGVGGCYYEPTAPADCGPYGMDDGVGGCYYEPIAPADCGPYGMDDYAGGCFYDLEEPAPLDSLIEDDYSFSPLLLEACSNYGVCGGEADLTGLVTAFVDQGDCWDTGEVGIGGGFESGSECVSACAAYGSYMANFGAETNAGYCYCEYKAEGEVCQEYDPASSYELWVAYTE